MTTAVVLSWNGREDTLACLGSLAGEPLTPLVVDNGSTDGSADAVAVTFPDVDLVRLDRNHGFAGGMNVGIRRALERGADQVLTLNNDVLVEPGFLAPLLEALAPDVASVSPQLLFADESERVWYAGAPYDPRRGHQGRNTGYGGPPLPPGPAFDTPRACGGALLAPREAWERVGLFDEALFAYWEDAEWSFRAHRLGLRTLVAPSSRVRHRVSASTGGASSPSSIYYSLRNGILVAERELPLGPVGTWRRRIEAVGAHAAQALLSSRRRAGLSAVAAATFDALRGRVGPR
ncbi:MAG: glycosyltransferase family 2 protein [Pseudomonadota bacterium]